MEATTVTFEHAGAQVTIESKKIADLWLAQLTARTEDAVVGELLKPPKIGSTWEGGIYMGIVRGDAPAGTEPANYHLVDLGEAPERMSWTEALDWAKARGGDLPTRREQAVMFGNRGEGQYKAEWYWSNAQSEGGSSYAWVQDFGDGGQDYDRKGLDFRARAVRRVAI